jgi:hypothetical protein
MRVVSVDIGRRHCGICCIDLSGVPNLLDLRVVSFGESAVVPTQLIVERMIEFWDAYPLGTPDEAVLEQQVPTSPINMALAYALMAYFRARRVPVSFIRAVDKLTRWTAAWPSLTSPPMPASYHGRKKYAVTVASMILEHMGCPPLSTFPGCDKGKMDDAADALLQSFCSCSMSARLDCKMTTSKE